MMKEWYKKLLANGAEIDFYARWAVRIILVIGVTYIALLKDTSKETIFVHDEQRNDSIYDRLIIVDHIIDGANYKDSIINIRYYEIPDYSNATSDSIHDLITESLNK